MSYSTILTALKTELETNPTQLLTSSYTVDGQTFNFKSIAEVVQVIKFLEEQVVKDSGGSRFFGIKPKRFSSGA